MPKNTAERIIDQPYATQAARTHQATPGGTVTHVQDHGALNGLADDDHLQYLDETRGDARYLRLDAYTATAVGQVLFSLDGEVFAACTPLISESGEWMTSDDDILMVVG